MRQKIVLLTITLVLILTCGLASAANVDKYRFAPLNLEREGIIPDLEAQLVLLPEGEQITAQIDLVKQVDLETLDTALTRDGLTTKRQRIEIVTTLLKEMADQTQRNLLKYLKEQEALGNASEIMPLSISNTIFVSATEKVLREIANRLDVAKLLPNYVVPLIDERIDKPVDDPKTTNCGLAKIQAQTCWSAGYNGNPNIIVSNIDTGVRNTHHQLDSNWRSTNGWKDAYGTSSIPVDNDGHGTGTMGIMAGTNDADGNIIGVCPECRWIACRAFGPSGGSSTDINECADWLLNTGQPDLVNNSWGAGSSGCDTWFQSKINAWTTAGIWHAFAAGNSGWDSSPANNIPAFAVGNVDCNDNYAQSSGTGPSDCDGTIFPEVCAPGYNTYTSDTGSDSAYMYFGGSSAATPHVCGAMALLLDADPTATFSEAKTVLMSTATDLGNAGADNTYGWGRINAYDALLEIPATIIEFSATSVK